MKTLMQIPYFLLIAAPLCLALLLTIELVYVFKWLRKVKKSRKLRREAKLDHLHYLACFDPSYRECNPSHVTVFKKDGKEIYHGNFNPYTYSFEQEIDAVANFFHATIITEPLTPIVCHPAGPEAYDGKKNDNIRYDEIGQWKEVEIEPNPKDQIVRDNVFTSCLDHNDDLSLFFDGPVT